MSGPRVAWSADYPDYGNYAGFSRHGKNLRAAAIKAGLELDDDAPVAVTVGSPRWWPECPGKKVVLSVAWECHELPEVTKKGAALADAFLVTSPFLADLFRREFPDKPVGVAPLGVDVGKFSFVRRRDPIMHKEPVFIFGWLGAANLRKGPELVVRAWEVFKHMHAMLGCPKTPKPVLYMKINPVGDGEVKCGPMDTITDTRRLSDAELCALYHSMNCLVYPSYGEGFGLVAAEAACTGMPVVFTPKTALGDIFGISTGYPVKWYWTKQIQDECEVQMPQADIDDIARQMMDVMLHYPQAVTRGIKAAEMIRTRYTWDVAGETFVSELARVMEEMEV
jgi:glycosyltransferase involved in cell wall biosynthesis